MDAPGARVGAGPIDQPHDRGSTPQEGPRRHRHVAGSRSEGRYDGAFDSAPPRPRLQCPRSTDSMHERRRGCRWAKRRANGPRSARCDRGCPDPRGVLGAPGVGDDSVRRGPVRERPLRLRGLRHAGAGAGRVRLRPVRPLGPRRRRRRHSMRGAGERRGRRHRRFLGSVPVRQRDALRVRRPRGRPPAPDAGRRVPERVRRVGRRVPPGRGAGAAGEGRGT